MPWLSLVFLFGAWIFSRMTTNSEKSYDSVPFGNVFQEAEVHYGLPRFLLVEVARAESNFNPQAQSNKGAQGIMQIVPRWHPDVNPFDPVASIWYAAKYLTILYANTGSWRLALAAYNWGIGNLKEFGIANAPKETKNYVAKITSNLPYNVT